MDHDEATAIEKPLFHIFLYQDREIHWKTTWKQILLE